VIPASGSFPGYVTALVRNPTRAVTLAGTDWSAAVESVEVERAVDGLLPDGTRIVQGAPSGKATVTLVGRDPVAALHPVRTGTTGAGDVSLVSATGSVSLGFAGENLQQIAGDIVSAVTTSARGADGAVEVEIVDPVKGWHAPITLPAAGPVQGGSGAVAKAPMRTSAIVTYVAHANGKRVTPAPYADVNTATMFATPLVGGAVPEVGKVAPWLDDGTGAAMTWRAGPFGTAWDRKTTVTCYPVSTFDLVGQLRWTWVEAWVYVGAGSGNTTVFTTTSAATGRSLVLTVNGNGSCTVALKAAGGADLATVSIASTVTGGQWLYFAGGIVRNGTAHVARIRRGTTDATAAATAAIVVGEADFTMLADMGLPTQAVGLHRQTVADTATAFPFRTDPPAAPAVTFPDGDLMSVLPDTYLDDSWDVLRALAAAELGSLDFDTAGNLRYRSRAQINALPSTVQRDYVVEAEVLEDVEWEVRADRVRTAVSVFYTQPVWALFSPPADSSVQGTPTYRLDRVLVCPPGFSTHYLQLPVRAAGVARDFAKWTNTAGPTTSSGMVLCSSRTATNPETFWSVTVTELSQTRLQLVVNNTSGVTLYSVWPSSWGAGPFGLNKGAPGLLIYAYRAEDPGDIAVTVSTGTELLPLSEYADWRQDPAAATAQASAVLTDLGTPVPVVRDITVPGDPRLELLDTVRVSTASGAVRPVTGRVIGIVRRFDDDGLVDRLTLAAAAE
jgi:hypothetical protein